MANETDLRRWLAAVAVSVGATPVWLEHAKGASQGVADVLLYIGAFGLPIELKCWAALQKPPLRFATRLRPAQVAWHARMALQGRPTLLLWASPGHRRVWCLPGHRAPRVASGRIDAVGCYSFALDQGTEFVAAIADATFWRGWRGGLQAA